MFELPTITTDDIEWSCRIMKLPPTAFSGSDGTDPRASVIKRMDSIDVEACPGSGKTTLLVAKLAILARRWTSSKSGICVLSHTNAARDEIDNRLSASYEGATLGRSPHFVGTIHGFVNEFLALPYLRSIGNPVRMIDTQKVIDRRWSMVPHNTRYYLDNKNNGDGRAFLQYDRDDFGGTRMSALGEHTKSFEVVRDICQKSTEDGYFCYDEMFVWAKRLLTDNPETSLDLRARFPLLFIDEVQDTDEQQSSLLHQVFMDGAAPSTRQRFGDSNQAIYHTHGVGEAAVTDAFPGSVKIDLPNSFRFGAEIGRLADPLAVVPQGLSGVGPATDRIRGLDRRPTIFLFDDETVRSVLAEYARYLIEVFSPKELSAGVFTAIAGVHKLTQDDQVPRAMGHYEPGYIPLLAGRLPRPDKFCLFVFGGWREANRSGHASPLVNAAGTAMLELLYRMGHDTHSRSHRNPHRTLMSLLKDDDCRGRYMKVVGVLVITEGRITARHWTRIKDAIISIAKNVTGKSALTPNANSFLDWDADDETGREATQPSANQFEYPAGSPSVTVRLGSIHSVKGETHSATMILDTFYYSHHLKALKPWLLGKKSGGAGARASGDNYAAHPACLK